jgi:hypothetical protein
LIINNALISNEREIGDVQMLDTQALAGERLLKAGG